MALGENERFTTDLADVDDVPEAVTTTTHLARSTTRSPARPRFVDGGPRRRPSLSTRPGRHGRRRTGTTTPVDPTATTVAVATPPPTTIPPATVPPVTGAPVTQLGVITDMSTVTPLSIPQGLTRIPVRGRWAIR